jgi:predicted kinase
MHYILIRGLPGSGKSTLAQALAMSYPDSNILEADQYFVNPETGAYIFDRAKLYIAHRHCQDRTRQSLAAGKTTIVSNTFTTVSELRVYFDIGAEFSLVPSVYLVQNDWGSIHNVPEETLANMKRRFHYDLTDLIKEYNVS